MGPPVNNKDLCERQSLSGAAGRRDFPFHVKVEDEWTPSISVPKFLLGVP